MGEVGEEEGGGWGGGVRMCMYGCAMSYDGVEWDIVLCNSCCEA